MHSAPTDPQQPRLASRRGAAIAALLVASAAAIIGINTFGPDPETELTDRLVMSSEQAMTTPLPTTVATTAPVMAPVPDPTLPAVGATETLNSTNSAPSQSTDEVMGAGQAQASTALPATSTPLPQPATPTPIPPPATASPTIEPTPIPPTPTAPPATPTPTVDVAPTPTEVPPTPAPTPGLTAPDMEAYSLGQINNVRAQAGLGALTWSNEVAAVARDWSAQMAARGGISHRPADQLSAMLPGGWLHWGENVAAGPDIFLAQSALEDSPGHLRNMVKSEYNTIGVGVVVGANGQIWITQNFGSY